MSTFNISKLIFNERVLGGVIYLVGVIFFHWPITTIIYLFWYEALLIGIITIIKMKKAEGPIDEEDNYMIDKGTEKNILVIKKGVITTFIMMYFAPTLFLGFILLILDLNNAESKSLLYGLLFMVINMTVSYWGQFVWTQEYKKVSPPELLVLPMVRYNVLFVFVFISLWVSLLSGNELAVLCVFIVSKVIIEQYFFLWNERRVAKNKLKMLNKNTN